MSDQQWEDLMYIVTVVLLAVVLVAGAVGAFGTHLAPDRCAPALSLDCAE